MTIPRNWPNGVPSMTVDSTSGLPKLLYTDMAFIDTAMQRALDKSAPGDSITGSSTIATGAALSFDTGTASLQVTGINTRLVTSSGGRIKCADNDVPVFTATRTATRVIDMMEYVDLSSTLTSPTLNRWNVDNAALTLKPNVASSTLWIPITRAWDGATLASVSAYFVVDGTRGGLPFNYPSIQVFRFNPFLSNPIANGGNLTADMSLKPSLNGFAFSPPANITAYINGGVPNVLTYTCSVNNVIDVANYSYFVQISDEPYDGTGGFVANKYVGLLASYNGIFDTRFQ